MALEPTDDGSHEELKTVILRTFSSHDTAEIARGNLEAHGIQCWVTSHDAAGMLPSLTAPGGVRLSVRASDAEAAVGLLNAQASSAELNQIEAEVEVSSPSKNAPRKKLAIIQIFIGIVVGVILCLLYQWSSKLGIKTYYYYTSDGKCKAASVYRDGHLIEIVQDRNLDGSWDCWALYENGEIVRSKSDNNFDGKPDEFVTYSNDFPATAERDSDFNGIPDEFVIHKDGELKQMDLRPNGAKFATQRRLYEKGVLVEILSGGDSNGNFKEDVRYDPFFNPISTNIPATFELPPQTSK